MKLTARDAVIALMAVVIAVLSWSLIYVWRDQLRNHAEQYEEEIEIETHATVEDGRAIVRIDDKSRAASGISVQALRAARTETSVQVYGSVVDFSLLLDLRGKYFAASGEQSATRASLETARAEYARAQMLFRDDRNISEQELRSAESRFRVAQARMVAADAAVSVLRDSLRTAWGPVVGAWAMEPDSASLQALLKGQSVLVRLVFPHELPRSSAGPQLLIAPVSTGGKQIEARFVSALQQGSSELPGNTYIYMANKSDLRAGTRVVARATTGEHMSDGVIVPNEAVVWHAGKAWAYAEQEPGTFSRYEISTGIELPGGWFQTGSMRAGDPVVVSGAQLLLSEELKFKIRNENED